jgi:hypothetical protein
MALTVGPAFCSGLIALAVLPSHGVAVPRWLILVCGFGCVLLALAAAVVSRSANAPRPSWQQRHAPRTSDQESVHVLLPSSEGGAAARPGRPSESAIQRA